MSLLSLKKLIIPSLSPKSSKALICNACSCLVHRSPALDFSQTASDHQDLHQCVLLYLLAPFSKVGSYHNIIFPPSSFLERSESVTLISNLLLFC